MANQNQVVMLRQMLERTEKQLDTMRGLLSKLESGQEVDLSAVLPKQSPRSNEVDGEVVEGIFDGVNMIGPDGRQFTVPANYASKSKLVEGDMLKLTITDDGGFIYKQIGPIDRKRIRGTLMQDDDTGEYSVMAQGNTYKVLAASITYYKGDVGDEVVILVPADKQSTWAAVENIIKQMGSGEQESSDEEVDGDLGVDTSDLL